MAHSAELLRPPLLQPSANHALHSQAKHGSSALRSNAQHALTLRDNSKSAILLPRSCPICLL